MKKTIGQILLGAIALMATAFALAAPPPERPPSLQQQMIFAKAAVVGGLVVDGMLAAQTSPQLDQVTVSFGSGQSDPPVMLKTVLPAGVLDSRTPLLQASKTGQGQALVVGYIKKICPALLGQGGSGCIGGGPGDVHGGGSGGIVRT
jgi:hypothetical protein